MTRPGPARMAILILLAGVCHFGCSSRPDIHEDPLLSVQDPRQPDARRSRAASLAWEAMERGRYGREDVRESLKRLAWSEHAGDQVRIRALDLLLEDADPEGRADARRMVILMLPTTASLPVLNRLCREIQDGGWTEARASLVRSLARPFVGVEDPGRPEYAALTTLFPHRPVTETAYSVFVDPDAEQFEALEWWESAARSDAWSLLGRLDRDGSVRLRLLTGLLEQDAPSPDQPELADILACLRDLRTIPLTGDELTWTRALRRGDKPGNAAWWSQAQLAVSKLDSEQSRGLRLRHAEPVRWASRHRPEWLSHTREELLSLLDQRLIGRRHVPRRGRADAFGGDESLARWAASMTWGDALGVLIVDEALQDPAVARTLLAQAELDRQDETTEFGGVLDADPRAERAGKFRVTMYAPREPMPAGDDTYVAPIDMIEQSDRALAHYHFHAQDADSSRFAGPSTGDLVYAWRSGRMCLVLTSLRADALNVDVYTPEGVVLDLGPIGLGVTGVAAGSDE